MQRTALRAAADAEIGQTRKEAETMAFERVDTKSLTEAIEVLFAKAVPTLPAISLDDIHRICSRELKYDVRGGQRHVLGTAHQLRPIVAWNLEKAPQQLYSGQRVVGFQVTVQEQLQFAGLTIFVGDASGSPGYGFGARVWRTADQLFVQGWEGFHTSPPVPPSLPKKPAAAPQPIVAATGGRKNAQDPQMLAGLRTQVLRQYDERLKAWPLGSLPKQTVTGVLGVSEREIGLEIKASEGAGTEFKLFVSFQIDDQEAILDFSDLIPISELGGVKGRPLWGQRQGRKELYSELATAKSQKDRSRLFCDAVRAGKIRKGDFKVSLILDYEAVARTGK